MSEVKGPCESDSQGKFRILIVEDEAPIRNALLNWFTIRGFDADIAEDGLMAVEKCNTNVYDIITMDVDMPRMSGPEAIAQIRCKHPDLPIVVLTGYDRSLREDTIKNVAKVLSKPIPLRALEDELRLILRNTHGVTP